MLLLYGSILYHYKKGHYETINSFTIARIQLSVINYTAQSHGLENIRDGFVLTTTSQANSVHIMLSNGPIYVHPMKRFVLNHLRESQVVVKRNFPIVVDSPQELL